MPGRLPASGRRGKKGGRGIRATRVLADPREKLVVPERHLRGVSPSRNEEFGKNVRENARSFNLKRRRRINVSRV